MVQSYSWDMGQGTSKLTSVVYNLLCLKQILHHWTESVESQVINNEPDKKRNIYQSHNNPDNVISSDDKDVESSSDTHAHTEQMTPAPIEYQATPEMEPQITDISIKSRN